MARLPNWKSMRAPQPITKHREEPMAIFFSSCNQKGSIPCIALERERHLSQEESAPDTSPARTWKRLVHRGIPVLRAMKLQHRERGRQESLSQGHHQEIILSTRSLRSILNIPPQGSPRLHWLRFRSRMQDWDRELCELSLTRRMLQKRQRQRLPSRLFLSLQRCRLRH